MTPIPKHHSGHPSTTLRGTNMEQRKRTNKLLYALQDFVSKDYTFRNIACIKFDLQRQTIEVTDGHAGIILNTSKGLIASLANEYAEYLGLDPVGGDFGVVKLAPKNGKKFPPERLPDEMNEKPDLWTVFRWDNQDPDNKSAVVAQSQLLRLNKLCKVLGVKLKLIPGSIKVAPLFQYGKCTYMGEEVKFCICQMPMVYARPEIPHVVITYESLDELDRETMKDFMNIHR